MTQEIKPFPAKDCFYFSMTQEVKDKLKNYDSTKMQVFNNENEIIDWVKEYMPFASLIGTKPNTNVCIRIMENKVLLKINNCLPYLFRDQKCDGDYALYQIGTVNNPEQVTQIEKIT